MWSLPADESASVNIATALLLLLLLLLRLPHISERSGSLLLSSDWNGLALGEENGHGICIA